MDVRLNLFKSGLNFTVTPRDLVSETLVVTLDALSVNKHSHLFMPSSEMPLKTVLKQLVQNDPTPFIPICVRFWSSEKFDPERIRPQAISGIHLVPESFTGIPVPLSVTSTVSSVILIVILLQSLKLDLIAASTELSIISLMILTKAGTNLTAFSSTLLFSRMYSSDSVASTAPMYIAGRLRICSLSVSSTMSFFIFEILF